MCKSLKKNLGQNDLKPITYVEKSGTHSITSKNQVMWFGAIENIAKHIQLRIDISNPKKLNFYLLEVNPSIIKPI